MRLIAGIAGMLFQAGVADAVTGVFFDSSQAIALAHAGITSDTCRTEGYLFTVTRDKLFTGGVGLTEPIGRYIRVPWPVGDQTYWIDASTDLSAAGWVQANVAIDVVGGFNVANLPLTGPHGFFRLSN